jgi:hypothetical protein
MTINAGYVENAPSLAQPGSPHTSGFDRFEYTIRVLSVHLFSPDVNRNALRRPTQTYASKYGYWNTAMYYKSNHEADENTAKSGVGPL